MPKECNREGTSVENEISDGTNNEISGDYDSDVKCAIGEHNDSGHDESGDINRTVEGKGKKAINTHLK